MEFSIERLDDVGGNNFMGSGGETEDSEIDATKLKYYKL